MSGMHIHKHIVLVFPASNDALKQPSDTEIERFKKGVAKIYEGEEDHESSRWTRLSEADSEKGTKICSYNAGKLSPAALARHRDVKETLCEDHREFQYAPIARYLKQSHEAPTMGFLKAARASDSEDEEDRERSGEAAREHAEKILDLQMERFAGRREMQALLDKARHPMHPFGGSR